MCIIALFVFVFLRGQHKDGARLMLPTVSLCLSLFFFPKAKPPGIEQGGITCGDIDEPWKSSKAIDEHVIIDFPDKNVVIVHFRDKNVFFLSYLYICIYF